MRRRYLRICSTDTLTLIVPEYLQYRYVHIGGNDLNVSAVVKRSRGGIRDGINISAVLVLIRSPLTLMIPMRHCRVSAVQIYVDYFRSF